MVLGSNDENAFCVLDLAIELVMAPLPKAAARPATVEECQRRAQWSTLFVPNPTRQNFWNR